MQLSGVSTYTSFSFCMTLYIQVGHTCSVIGIMQITLGYSFSLWLRALYATLPPPIACMGAEVPLVPSCLFPSVPPCQCAKHPSCLARHQGVGSGGSRCWTLSSTACWPLPWLRAILTEHWLPLSLHLLLPLSPVSQGIKVLGVKMVEKILPVGAALTVVGEVRAQTPKP